MADVASLILKADSTEIRKADKDLDGLTKGAGKAETASGKLADISKKVAAGLAIVAAAAAAVTVAMVKMSLVSIDSLAKTADRIGITTEKLAGLHLAAELAGMTNETLNQSLEYLANNSNEAAKGIGTALDAFKDLNINAADFARFSPDKQMAILADKMKDVGTQGKKLQIARDLFGRGGGAMVNLLDAGSKAMEEATERAMAYGTALSRVDAAKIEAANDAITEAKTAFAGVAATLTIQLAPMIKAVADEFSGAALKADGFKDTIINAVEFSSMAIGKLADVVWGVKIGFHSLAVASLGAFYGIESGIASLDKGATDLYNKFVAKNSIFGIIKEVEINPELAVNAKVAADAFYMAGLNLTALMLQGSPSANVVVFFDALRAKAEAAGKAIADAAAARAGGGDGEVFVPPKGASAAFYEGQAAERFKFASYLHDIIVKDRKAKNEALLEIAIRAQLDAMYVNDEKLADERRYQEYLFGIQQEASDRGIKLAEDAAEMDFQLAKDRDALILQARENFMNNMAGLMNTGSRKVFAIGKVAAIAQAAIKGKLAVIEAWEAGMSTGGPWAPIVAGAYAAAAAANAGSMIANISGATFGGGGGPATAPTQGASGYSGGGFDMGGLSGAGGADNTLLIELTQAIKALKGIPVGQIITQGLAAAGGIVTASADGHINELAHEISGSNYV